MREERRGKEKGEKEKRRRDMTWQWQPWNCSYFCEKVGTHPAGWARRRRSSGRVDVCMLLSTCAGIQISQCSRWYFSLQCITIVLGLDVKQHPDHIMRFSPNVTDWNCCHDASTEGKNQKTKVQQFPALLVCLFGDHEGGDIPPTRALSGLLPKVKCCSSQ